ncbi:MAG: virulence RhuM family protein [Kiritimatiellae bacterium]|nr:virulence RhuM family protein [Kiritimatiellia bacterium]
MARKNVVGKWDIEPQKSSTAQFITYIASTGASDEKYDIRYEDENIWMSQKMLAAIYGVEVPNIAYHLRKLFADAELDKLSVVKEILITANDDKKYRVNHYNLQVIIALGFKIDNERAIAFRKWANQIVSEYTIKGWVMDVPRLKDGAPISDKYFEHQLERIREIRLSERKFYQKITDLYATSIDYDKNSNLTRLFYATVQNRMHCAVHGHTAAELLYTRADAEKEHMGLNSWEDAPNGKIKKSDVIIAKNYLTDDELKILERMVSAFLEYAETQTLRKIPLTMEDWKKRLEKFLELFDQHAPKYIGDPVSAYKAQLYAESEFEKYRIIQDRLFMSDYDRYLLELEEQVKTEKDDWPCG